ncbi:hypothetical protein EON83_12530 [bacterium]|nr:MAG: hypothetical protein EON83_12530 [bacterium]
MVDSIRIASRPHEVIESETITLPDGTKRTVEKRKQVHKPEMALEWLKRRRREEWGDNVRLDVDDEITRLLAALAAGSKNQTS